jgi:hypothetical protein
MMFALTFYLGKWCRIKQVMDYIMKKMNDGYDATAKLRKLSK